MKSKTQEKWVIETLNSQGEISRNFALQNFVSRLGAIICDLNKDGWDIQGSYRKTGNSKDFVYKVIKSPLKKQDVWRINPVTKQPELLATKWE